MKPIRIAALALLGLAAVALAGAARPEAAQGEEPKPGRSVTVSGTGTVESVPDSAQFSFGVESLGASAKEALDANTAEMRQVIDALRKAGMDLRDLRTQNVSLNPRYGDDGKQVVGYAATNSVSAQIEELARAGTVVDAAVAAGANQVYGPSLVREDRDELYRQALDAAVAEARAKAQTLAEAGGAAVGQVVKIVEGSAAEPPMPFYERAAAADAARSVPIQPGTEKIEATVTVTYALT
jgi:uncharacterized protein YggE